ncbi:hypothetical protein INS49_012170 [Diaporthe citri]|uniref:uncharacterized protein n=1 Tax=Diaporthe citri TaxID=83186 RepID=UPI001C81FCB2|nr:uncharacterized protein INS49_012170 [Diaporthe citri]KAG6358652.1 hypothetical protein INS49_012170 [Diaporthe citri]
MSYTHGKEDRDDAVERRSEEATQPPSLRSPECQAGARRMKSTDLGILFTGERPEIFESVSKLGFGRSLVLANKSPSPADHVRKGRIVDPEYMDLGILKHWKSHCLTSHGTRCQNPMRIWPTCAAWLVDVKQKCVVRGDDPTVSSSPFVALSYRRETEPGAGVMPESMLGLQRPGILDEEGASGWVSPLVRHAMYLTAVLGERYLWVDTLCIVHGDGTTAEQLGLMGAIYASAMVVIVAADGDAQDGIAGLKGIPESLPRKSQQCLIPFGDDETIVARTNSPFSLIHGGPYYERGWTFQEHKMASRKLFLKDGLAHWECQHSLWHEDLVRGVELDKYIEPRLREVLAGFPMLSSLSNIIGNYNDLELRYEEDALPGIMGLLSVLSRSFTGESPTTAPHDRREIRSSWYEQRSGWKKSAADVASPLPAGWTRREVKPGSTSTFRDEPLLWPEECEGYVYKHKNLPDEDYGPTDTFFYPFPVPDITEATPPDMPEQTKYLFCTTLTARLWTRGEKVVDRRVIDTDSSLCISIHDASGDAVGELQLHDHDQLKRLEDASVSTELGVQVEIVAINRVRTWGNTFIEEEQRRGLPQWTRDEYTVLWIERTGSVAYRNAVGSIEKSKWERLDLEQVELVMG